MSGTTATKSALLQAPTLTIHSLSQFFSTTESTLITKFYNISNNALIGTNGLGASSLIGENGYSIKSYGGIPESILWKLMKKKPSDTPDDYCVSMNAILFRLENMLKYGILLDLNSQSYTVSFGVDPNNINFDVSSTQTYTVHMYLPNVDDTGTVSWTDKIATGTFQKIFIQLLTLFNLFCDKSTNMVLVTTPPPPTITPTVVTGIISNFVNLAQMGDVVSALTNVANPDNSSKVISMIPLTK